MGINGGTARLKVTSQEPGHDSCSCDSRKAAGVDPAIKDSNLKRLRRIEGQVRGLQRMVEEDRYCPDIMVQVSAVHEALRTVGRSLMRNHLQHCVTQAVKSSAAESQTVYDELLDLIYKHSR
jgi:DNA-binding FrmR family transcriptional regulator